MAKINKPLTPLLQKIADKRPLAQNFYKEYLELCNKHKAEIQVNGHGLYGVCFDDGMIVMCHTMDAMIIKGVMNGDAK